MEEKLKYRYFASGRSGVRQVHPVNGQKFSISYNESQERIDYEVKLSEKLKFIGDDFLWLYTLEKTIYRCDFISLAIEKYCNGVWSPFFSGRISLNSGDPWDLDKFQVELAISESANYDCIDDGGDEDYNLFNYIFNRVTVAMLSGTLENKSFTGNMSGPDLTPDLFPGEPDPYSKGWSQKYVSYQYENFGSAEVPSLTLNWQVEWIREVKITPTGVILPAPWIFLENQGSNDKYVRQAILYNPTFNSYNPNSPEDYSVSYQVLNKVIDNGLQLRDVFEKLIQLTCPQLTIESDFFQWNPIDVSPINYITGEPSKVLNLVLFQKSDVKRPDANSNATIVKTNLVDLVKDICNIFQLKYAVTDDAKFKIEHVDYYKNRGLGLDTTTPDLSKFTAGNRIYSYDKDQVPKYETFRFMELSYGDFTGVNIVYSGSCAGQGDTKEINYNVEKITTDVQLCLSNPLPDSAVSDDGFVLMAADAAGTVIREASIFGGNIVNNSLAWAQLHRDYWRYNRAQKTFQMNNTLTSALSVKPTKLQGEFKIPFCCGTFDPKLFVKSTLGDKARIKTAKYDMYTEKLTLSLLHPADDGLFENEKPITIGDTAETFVNLSVIIDVIANDSDPDGQIIPSTLKILGGPSHGTAVITPDFKVLYTPALDYIGTDIFIYNVQDNFQEPSANTIVNITVKPGSPNVIAHDDNFSIASTSILNVTAPGIIANDTGPTTLTAIPETKSTTGGGSVQIFANGGIQYVPPVSPAILPFIDSFEYTVKDINDLIDNGKVNVNVFEPSPVYVKLVSSNNIRIPIIENCAGSGSQLVGERRTQDFQLQFYSDEAKTIPVDVTNYGILINIQYENLDHGLPTGSYIIHESVNGSTYVLHNGYEISFIYDGCSTSENINQSTSLTLQPGIGYNI